MRICAPFAARCKPQRQVEAIASGFPFRAPPLPLTFAALQVMVIYINNVEARDRVSSLADSSTQKNFRKFDWVPRFWVALAVLFLLWQAVMYRGFQAIAAEWEFEKLGAYHPAITFQILLLVLASPPIIWELYRWRRHSRTNPSEQTRCDYAIAAAQRSHKLISTLCIVTALCALAVAGYALLGLPSARGPIQRVVVTGNELPPALGPVDLEGNILASRVAVSTETLFGNPHTSSFVPVVAAGASQSSFAYFVELPGTPLHQTAGPARGILRRGGLPAGLVALYRSAGFTIAPDYYVLFVSSASMRRPYLVDMAEFLVFSLFLGLVSLLISMRIRRLNRARSLVDI